MGGFAWVTLATNDSYSLGALVLAHSLKQAGTKQQLAVLVTPGVTGAMREKLSTVFNVVQEVNILDSRDEANLRLLKRPELGITFTKLHCWRLTQYDKCVFLDADTLVLQNCDELFDREELSAAPDVGWPDCFNSGVFVFRPSNETYEKLITFAIERGSFDGGDQGLLNLYFSDWAHKDISKHLPFIYNMCSTACYSYLPAFKQFGGNAKIMHFIGATKPWLQYFNTETKKVQPSGDSNHLTEVLQRWWDIFCSLIHPQLTPNMAGLAGAFAQLTLGVPRTPEQIALDDILRRQAWEVGNIDYLGKDSFENIWSKIEETLSLSPTAAAEPVPEAPKEEKPQEPQSPISLAVAIPSPTLEEAIAEAKAKEPLPPIALPPPPESPKITSPQEPIQAEPISTEPQVEKITETVKEETPKEVAVNETAVETPKETPAETPKEASPEAAKETPVEIPKESPVEAAKEIVAEVQPEIAKVSEQQTVLSPPLECPLPQKPAEDKTVSEPIKQDPAASKETEAQPEPVAKETKVEAVAESAAVEPETKNVEKEAPSCPIPSAKTEITTEAKVSQPEKVVTEVPATQAEAKISPAAEVTAPTPPTSPPVDPQIKQIKETLAVDTSIPDTPPPTSSESGAGAPVPPPRKASGPKKPSGKSKK